MRTTKDEIRWELAHISMKLNRLLKAASVSGPTIQPQSEIHYLRERRDELLNELQGF